MIYTLYDTIEGMIKVYRDAGYEYYLDIDNRYDMAFDTEADFQKYMQNIKAEYVGIDED